MDYYLLINAQSPAINSIENDCRTRHGMYTAAELSRVDGFYGNEVLIKVRGGDAAWLDLMPWTSSVIKHLERGNENDDNIRLAWCEAQDASFDSDNDGDADTPQERRAWWQKFY